MMTIAMVMVTIGLVGTIDAIFARFRNRTKQTREHENEPLD